MELLLRIVNSAIGLGVASGILTCLLVAVLFLGELLTFDLADIVAILFIAAVAFMAAALVQFLREVRIAIRDISVREELLERD